MKNIYIVLTYTGTLLSRIIKCYTHYEYSHTSLSLDKDLKQMYSFGRLNPYNPFVGGFVHEEQYGGTFGRFKKTVTKIIEMEITEEQYEKLCEILEEEFISQKEKYKFNLKGLFAISIGKKIVQKDAYYCAEFLKYILNKAGIKLNLPELVKPQDFNKDEFGKTIYYGLLRNYKYENSIIKEEAIKS